MTTRMVRLRKPTRRHSSRSVTVPVLFIIITESISFPHRMQQNTGTPASVSLSIDGSGIRMADSIIAVRITDPPSEIDLRLMPLGRVRRCRATDSSRLTVDPGISIDLAIQYIFSRPSLAVSSLVAMAL